MHEISSITFTLHPSRRYVSVDSDKILNSVQGNIPEMFQNDGIYLCVNQHTSMYLILDPFELILNEACHINDKWNNQYAR